MIKINQQLSYKDCKQAFYTHFFSYKYTYLIPILGILMLLVYLILWSLKQYPLDARYLIVIVIALLFITRPIRYVYAMLNSFKTTPDFGKSIQIIFSEEESKITVLSENTSSVFNMINLYAYSNNKRFLFLYTSKNQFMILDKKQITLQDISSLIDLLNRKGIKKK